MNVTSHLERGGSKDVTVIFINFYGYDAKGKQVVMQELDFNRTLKGGDTTEVETRPDKAVTTWEATYHGISFVGEQMVFDPKRAPAKRPRGA